jgi:hypothetical protein
VSHHRNRIGKGEPVLLNLARLSRTLVPPFDSSRRIASLTTYVLYDEQEEEARLYRKRQPVPDVLIWPNVC